MHNPKASFIIYTTYYQLVIMFMYVGMSFTIKCVTQDKGIRINQDLILNYKNKKDLHFIK